MKERNNRHGAVLKKQKIQQRAREFCKRLFPNMEKNCNSCNALNCKYNDKCIQCGCKF